MISFKKVLAGMAIKEKDIKIAAYLDFLANKLGIEEVCNFHAFTVNSLYHELNMHREGMGDELIERIQKRLDNEVRSTYKNIPKVSSSISVGRTDKGLLHQCKDWGSDFIALGKLADGNSIVAKNVVRYLPSNTLIIPETAKHTLSHILVPVDLSEHSGKLIEAALAIQKNMGESVKITCFHAFEPPYLPYYATLRTEEVFKAGYTARFKVALDKFVKKYAASGLS